MPAKRKSNSPAPAAGFAGAAPEQSGWFATNHLIFKNGVLHQLHKGTDPANPKAETKWWWFPVAEVE